MTIWICRKMNDTLKYKGYIGTVHYEAEDELFAGKIFGIIDLVTFEGESVAEIKAAFKEAVDDYLETCKSLGKEPNKTYKGSFNVRVSTGLHQKASIMALKNGMTLNEFVKRAIDYAVSHKLENMSSQ